AAKIPSRMRTAGSTMAISSGYLCFPCSFERWYCGCEAPACRCIHASILCHKRSSQFRMVDSFAGTLSQVMSGVYPDGMAAGIADHICVRELLETVTAGS